MRGTKFRGLDIDGQWRYGNSRYNAVDCRCEIEVFVDVPPSYSEPGGDQLNLYFHIPDPKTIGQYTGLKDKTGKEIYEGDIVDPHGGNLKAVTWVGVGFSLVNYQGTAGFIDQLYHCSVVGDIYANPELLEKPSDL